MANAQNVDIGPCSLTFDGNDLGHTMGGTTLTYEREHTPLEVDQYATEVDAALSAESLEVTANLAEPTVLNLSRVIPEGSYETGSGTARLGIGRDAGYRASEYAAELVLHPLKNAANDDSEDVTLYKAYPTESVELPYQKDEQRVFETKFRAMIDETKPNGRRLGHVGNEDLS